MPVRKFRSVEEMPGRQALTPLDPRNLDLLFELLRFTNSLHPMRRTPGVTKFRSMAEANAHRQAWVSEQIRETRERRLAEQQMPPTVDDEARPD